VGLNALPLSCAPKAKPRIPALFVQTHREASVGATESEASLGRGGQRMVQVTMTYMNKVELKGFLGADAHPTSLEGGKSVLNFSLATKTTWGKGDARQERTQWHRVEWHR